MADQHLDAERTGLGENLLAGFFAAIDDRGNGNAGPLQVEGGLVGRIMGGVDTDLGTHGDAEVVEIGARG